MKKYYVFFYCLCLVASIYSQENSFATAIAEGGGNTKNKAEKEALRSAVEQAFGVFISSTTNILNDELISDDISTISSGNIKSYEVLSADRFDDGSWRVTVKAIVSITALKNFISSKGYQLNVNSKTFAFNMNQQKLNEQGEVNVLLQTIGFLHNQMQNSYDYKLGLKKGTSNFYSVDGRSDLFKLDMQVTASPNENFVHCINYLIGVLDGLNMKREEIENYKGLKKEVLPLYIKFKDEQNNIITRDYRLRNRQSMETIALFFNLFNFYSRIYQIDSGMDVQISPGRARRHALYNKDFACSYKTLARAWNARWFLKSGYQTYNSLSKYGGGVDLTKPERIFSWEEKRTLFELENINDEFKVKPLGVVMPYKFGGILLYYNPENKTSKGKVMSLTGRIAVPKGAERQEIKNRIENTKFNGYDDWFIANRYETISASLHCIDLFKFESDLLYFNLFRKELNPFYYLFNLPWVSTNFKDCMKSTNKEYSDAEMLKNGLENHNFTKYQMGAFSNYNGKSNFIYPNILYEKNNSRYNSYNPYFSETNRLKFSMWGYLIRDIK